MAQDEIVRLIQDVNEGKEQAFDSLVTLAYGELRRMASSLMRGRVHGSTLQPTALVNEA
jgi:RNA polymerase sigma-70 factor, ECF subfamily